MPDDSDRDGVSPAGHASGRKADGTPWIRARLGFILVIAVSMLWAGTSTASAETFTVPVGQTISPGQPGFGAGAISPAGNVDVYNFTPAAGQTHLYFNVQSESGSGCVNANVTQGSTTVVGNWPLYHAIINNCTQFPNPSGNDRGPIAVTPGLTYTLTVSGSGAATGNYRIQILNAPRDTFNVPVGQTISRECPRARPPDAPARSTRSATSTSTPSPPARARTTSTSTCKASPATAVSRRT